MEQTTIKVQGMSCGHCVNAVETSVGKIDGVATVMVDLNAGNVDVQFDKSKVSLNEIKQEIEEQGYDVI